MSIMYTESYLAHHGIKGQKWGIRRYQNEDGSLTAAGRKRYGADLDLNDKSLSNIAKIRTGEAKRRLDVAKSNNDGTNHTRIAELTRAVRTAKRNERYASSIEKGAKRVAKGETITGNQVKSYLMAAGATMASKILADHLNSRLRDLASTGKYTEGHRMVAQMIAYAPALVSYGYGAKKAIDNANIRKYNRALWTGQATKSHIGGSEYRDVIKRNKQ